jgi:ABC-type multidrug transport system fused ATPase/permease subunit
MTRKSINTQGPDIVLFRLMYHAVKPHWRPLAIAFVLLGITAGLNVVPPSLLQWAIDGPITTGDTADLWPITALYGGTAVAMFIIQYVYSYYLQQAGQRALSDMRTNLFNRIMSQDQAFFHRNPVGDLVTRLTSDIDTLSALISTSAVTIVTETATLLVTTIVMFSVNWRLALLVVAVLPVLVVVTNYFSARVRSSSTGERTALARVSAYLNEQLQGIPVLQVFGAQQASTSRFDGFNNAYRNPFLAAGYRISGTSPDGRLVELIELEGHPFFTACQYHPEFLSRPGKPHPLFRGLIEAAQQRLPARSEEQLLAA